MGLQLIAVTLSVVVVSYLCLQWRSQRKIDVLREIHNCKPVRPRVPYKWPLALDLFKRQYDALYSGHTMEAFNGDFGIAGTVRFELFGGLSYISSDPENVEAVLSTHFEDYGVGPRRLAFFPLIGEGIFGQDGPAWKQSRELIRRQFARVYKQNLHAFTPHVNELLSTLQDAASDAKIVDMKPFFFEYTLNTTTNLLFGESQHSLAKDERGAVRDNFECAAMGVAIRLRLADFAWLYNPAKFANACKNVREWASIFSGRAMRYKDEVGEEEAFKKYSFIIDMWKELGDEGLVRDQLLHILVAGRESTAALLCYVLFHLVRNPSVLDRLMREVSLVPMDSDITRDQIQKLPFLRCCLNETLRLYPTVPLNLRIANKTTVLPRGGGPEGQSPVLFTKGTGIAFSVYHLHRLESLYGPDSKVWRPERWESGKLIKDVRLGVGFIDFNAGPRTCLGKDFALMEASYAVIRILQTFPNIRLAPGVPNEPVGVERQDYLIGISPGDGVKVLLT